jgi:hypothetical protein
MLLEPEIDILTSRRISCMTRALLGQTNKEIGAKQNPKINEFAVSASMHIVWDTLNARDRERSSLLRLVLNARRKS